MGSRERFRPGFWTFFFALVLAAASVVTVLRYWKGLGAVTNLSDKFPWGLWVGFDVLCGVGLAAGGFTITTAVYVFNLKRFQPIVRPTIITAFLGYILVAVGLMYDLGKPWNIWHPMVMWNPRSAMFEVSWCVMLYLTVLALEFSGMVFERLGWPRLAMVVDCTAPGNRADPAPERRRLTQLPEVPEGVHEHVLDEILGILTCETGNQHTMDGAAEASIQLSERFAVTAGRGGDERREIRVGSHAGYMTLARRAVLTGRTTPSSCRRSVRCRPPRRAGCGGRRRPGDSAAHRAYRASAERCRC